MLTGQWYADRTRLAIVRGTIDISHFNSTLPQLHTLRLVSTLYNRSLDPQTVDALTSDRPIAFLPGTPVSTLLMLTIRTNSDLPTTWSKIIEALSPNAVHPKVVRAEADFNSSALRQAQTLFISPSALLHTVRTQLRTSPNRCTSRSRCHLYDTSTSRTLWIRARSHRAAMTCLSLPPARPQTSGRTRTRTRQRRHPNEHPSSTFRNRRAGPV